MQCLVAMDSEADTPAESARFSAREGWPVLVFSGSPVTDWDKAGGNDRIQRIPRRLGSESEPSTAQRRLEAS